jgi:hypothetical protein
MLMPRPDCELDDDDARFMVNMLTDRACLITAVE